MQILKLPQEITSRLHFLNDFVFDANIIPALCLVITVRAKISVKRGAVALLGGVEPGLGCE